MCHFRSDGEEGSWMHLVWEIRAAPLTPLSTVVLVLLLHSPQLRGSQFSPEQEEEEERQEGGGLPWYKTSFALSFLPLPLSSLHSAHHHQTLDYRWQPGWRAGQAGAAQAELTDKLIGTYMHSHTRASQTEGRRTNNHSRSLPENRQPCSSID